MKNTYQEQLDSMLQAAYNKLNVNQRKFLLYDDVSLITHAEAAHLYELGILAFNCPRSTETKTVFGDCLIYFIRAKRANIKSKVEEAALEKGRKAAEKVLHE